MKRQLLLLPLLLLVFGCANRTYKTEHAQFYADYAPIVQIAADQIRTASRVLGELNAEGIVSDADAAKVKTVLKMAEQSRRACEEVMASYLEGGSSRAVVFAAVAQLNLRLAEVFKLLPGLAKTGEPL